LARRWTCSHERRHLASLLGLDGAAVVDGRLVEHQLMTLTLTCDHRICYGTDAAQFLSAIRALLEQLLVLAF